mgnify:CR=1 FL=1
MKNYIRHEDFELNRIFLKELRDNKDDISWMYNTLFESLDPKQLNQELGYINELHLGKNDFHKENGKENWFYIFHKGVRQVDYFQDIFQRKTIELVDDTELKEMRYLKSLLVDKKIKKRDDDGNFSKEYKRYLKIYELKRRETIEEDISGKFDALLWGLINLDKNDVLYKTFEVTFEKYRIKKLEPIKI